MSELSEEELQGYRDEIAALKQRISAPEGWVLHWGVERADRLLDHIASLTAALAQARAAIDTARTLLEEDDSLGTLRDDALEVLRALKELGCELCEVRSERNDALKMEEHYRAERDALRAENVRIKQAAGPVLEATQAIQQWRAPSGFSLTDAEARKLADVHPALAQAVGETPK